MTQTLFGLTTSAVLLGFVAVTAAAGGCSGGGSQFYDLEGGPAPSPSPGTTGDSAVSSPPIDLDSGTGADANDAGGDASIKVGLDGGAVSCPVTEPLDATSLLYLPARVQTGRCQEEDITFLEALVDQSPSGVSFPDAKIQLTAHDATCAACVFSPAGATWAPLVEQGSDVLVNMGGCMELTCGSVECGRRWQQFQGCVDYGCSACTTAQQETDCDRGIAGLGAPCEAALSAVKTACGADFLDCLNLCFPDGALTISGPIRRQCIAN